MIRSYFHIYLFLFAVLLNSIHGVTFQGTEFSGAETHSAFYCFLDSRRFPTVYHGRDVKADYYVDISIRNAMSFVFVYVVFVLVAIFIALFDEFNEKVEEKRKTL